MASKKAPALATATPPKKGGFTIGGVSEKQLTQFTVQLSTLQDAGLPIVSCLKILEGQMPRGFFKNVLVGVTDDVESGASLSEAMAKHPKVFDGLYVNMVRAGEAGGVLDVILSRLAAFKEKAERLRRRIKGAATYPVAVLIVIVLILLFIMTSVVPKFEEVFSGLPGGQEGLPPITKVMMEISRWLVEYWWIFLLIVFLLFWGLPRLIAISAKGRYFMDELKIRSPVVGDLYKKILVARFTRTFGTLIASGVPILEALDIVRGAAGNAVMSRVIGDVHDAIREGESIAEPLGNQRPRIFDDLVVNMIDVGEKTGELDKMLIKVADNFDDEVDVAVGSMTSLLEPMLIVVMGGAVFAIVLALFLPLLRIIDTLTGGVARGARGMSLRLRILLLIAAVNVGALLLVVGLGLGANESVALPGPAALEEALEIAYSERPADFRRHAVSLLVRLGGPGRGTEPEIVAPPELLEEAEVQRERLLALLDAGVPVYEIDSSGLTVVYPDAGREWSAYHVGFNDYAGQEAIRNLRTVYVLLCGSTVLLIVGTYLILRRLVLRPLDQLMEASRAVAQGQTPSPVPRPRGDDEMARLVDTFNRMAAEAHEYQAHLEERVMSALHRVTAAEGRLVVAQRLAATGTLAAGFAHEINNPVGGISNALRKLQEGELSPDKREEYFTLVHDGVERIRTIVERILHFTPRERGPTAIDVAEVCRRAAALARHRAERRGVEVEVSADEPVRGVEGDPQELTQAVLNLILNAIDAIPEGRGGRVGVSALAEEDEAVLAVADDGVGMDPVTARRCVDFFFSTKPEGEGTGLGLAIVQHIVTDHGGTLEIDSDRGRGTTVRIRLPFGPAG